METGHEQYIPKRSTRKKIVLGTLAGCGAIVAYLIAVGDPNNTLHTSALSWAFTLSGGTIGGYIFGAVWDNKNSLTRGE